MSEWSLFCIIMLLASFSVALILYPLRAYKRFIFFTAPIWFLFIVGAYFIWGYFFEVQSDHLRREKELEIQAILQSPPKTESLIQTMLGRLERSPNNAQGWYLVGKLYLSQKKYKEAAHTFARAYQLKPDDIQIGLYHAQSLWTMHHQHFNDKSRSILKHILALDSNQPDALAMLAMDAYTEKHMDDAVRYWNHLLLLLPEDSPQAKAIKAAIKSAQ